MQRHKIEQTALEQIARRAKPAAARRSAFGWVEAVGTVLWLGVVGLTGLILWLVI